MCKTFTNKAKPRFLFSKIFEKNLKVTKTLEV